jgi:hypothetical protein
MPIWPAEPTETAAYPFNPQETARLSVYRAAIAAGFYTDKLTLAKGTRADARNLQSMPTPRRAAA